MKGRLRLRSEASRELEEAQDYYDEVSFGLGRRFIEAVDEALCRVEEYPLRWPKVRNTPLHAEIRSAQVHTFPYSVVYRIIDDCVVVLAVKSHRREPSYWMDRIEEAAAGTEIEQDRLVDSDEG